MLTDPHPVEVGVSAQALDNNPAEAKLLAIDDNAEIATGEDVGDENPRPSAAHH